MTSALRMLGICVALLVAVNVGRAADDDKGFIGVQIKLSPNGDGILIVAFVEDSPAEKAGLKTDDIILKANGNKVGTLMEFIEAVRDTKPGETILLAIKRGDKEMELKVKVGKAPAPTP
jgi:S1-C subfamily serine protease